MSRSAWPTTCPLGSYFGGRKAEDGRIDWTRDAKTIHDLVRAVAPPYPGATTVIDGRAVTVERTRVVEVGMPIDGEPPVLVTDASGTHACCGDGRWLDVVTASIDGERLDGIALADRLGHRSTQLGGVA